jgi:hypothetical protein
VMHHHVSALPQVPQRRVEVVRARNGRAHGAANLTCPVS